MTKPKANEIKLYEKVAEKKALADGWLRKTKAKGPTEATRGRRERNN
jgi:hypothetical protein